MKKIFRKLLTPLQGESLKSKYLDENYGEVLITEDCDGYDLNGNLLFRFRKNQISKEEMKLGYESFKDSIISTTSRGNASGGYYNRIRKDGTESNFKISNETLSGNVGFMDAKEGFGTTNYCRKTSFASSHFEEFTAGIPFVKKVDQLYKQLCPNHWEIQNKYARSTNRNYVIADTVFTTVTVNKNFRTAVHKDSGDLETGFGNLTVYEEGSYSGGYFMLPEWGIMIDLKCGDVLFVDVHQWHCNTPFVINEGFDEMLRISFVMYYREYMYRCPSPSKVLEDLKNNSLGYSTL